MDDILDPNIIREIHLYRPPGQRRGVARAVRREGDITMSTPPVWRSTSRLLTTGPRNTSLCTHGNPSLRTSAPHY